MTLNPYQRYLLTRKEKEEKIEVVAPAKRTRTSPVANRKNPVKDFAEITEITPEVNPEITPLEENFI